MEEKREEGWGGEREKRKNLYYFSRFRNLVFRWITKL